MAHTDNNLVFCDLDSDADDDSGNGNNGTNVGGVTFDGSKATFSGSNYIALPSLGTLAGDFTLVIWANCSATTGIHELFGLVNSGGTVVELLPTDYPSGGFNWKALCSNSGGPDIDSGVSAVGLSHVALTRVSGTITLYVNGVAHGTLSNSASFAASSPNIGNRAGGGFMPFVGTAQSAAVYSVGRDSTWITDDYNAGTPKKWADWAGGGGGGSIIPQVMHHRRQQAA